MRTYSTKGPHRDPAVRNHFVYRCWDAEGRLLYVGCSRRPMDRIREHRHDPGTWVDEIARITLQGPFNYQTARQREYDAINTEDPRENRSSVAAARERALKRRHFKSVTRRYQRAGLGFFEAVEAAYAEIHGRAAA